MKEKLAQSRLSILSLGLAVLGPTLALAGMGWLRFVEFPGCGRFDDLVFITAVASLFVLPPITICVAVWALVQIKRTDHTVTGRTRAAAALLLAILTAASLLLLVPVHRTERIRSSICSCTGNMMMIDAMKEQWALEAGVRSGPVELDGILQFVKGNTMPVCYIGGTYTVGDLGEDPSCSIHGPRGQAHDGSPKNIKRIRRLIKEQKRSNH